MKLTRSALSVLRKALLIGWAAAVIWIYLGNLVNFHQNRIWGKQLIPVACSSTRAKEKDALTASRADRSVPSMDAGHHFDFSAPESQAELCPPVRIADQFPVPAGAPVSERPLYAFSLRGPPTV
jgi:hypothetical protein